MANRRVQSVRGRAFAIDLPAKTLARMQDGVFKTTWRGLAFLKNPLDMLLYTRLLQQLRPGAIIEVGSYQGGSALWFADQLHALQLDTRVISIDIQPPKVTSPRVAFLKGDAANPDATFMHDMLVDLPRPWLVIEDSAHTFETTIGSLRYFDKLLRAGDYLVVEDGCVADLEGTEYDRLEDGPNRAVAEFLNTTGDRYRIDENYCDFYGHNVTYCPNAWLARV